MCLRYFWSLPSSGISHQRDSCEWSAHSKRVALSNTLISRGQVRIRAAGDTSASDTLRLLHQNVSAMDLRGVDTPGSEQPSIWHVAAKQRPLAHFGTVSPSRGSR